MHPCPFSSSLSCRATRDALLVDNSCNARVKLIPKRPAAYQYWIPSVWRSRLSAHATAVRETVSSSCASQGWIRLCARSCERRSHGPMRAMIAMNGWEDVHTRGQTVTSAVSIGAGWCTDASPDPGLGCVRGPKPITVFGTRDTGCS